MIICHKHKYVFIELPLTGTIAIRKELIENYDGQPILKKHSTYRTFLRQASEAEKAYFAFSCIRHPMDTVVSHYFKLKSDHFDFENPDRLAKRNRLNRWVYSTTRLKQIRFIREHDADFATFFLRFYRAPYSSWSILSHHDLDFVIRFEKLNEGFEAALSKLGLEQVRPLPVRNATRERRSEFLAYYTEATHDRARKVFLPFMQEWGYQAPEAWGNEDVSAVSRVHYRAVNLFRRLYWTHLKHEL